MKVKVVPRYKATGNSPCLVETAILPKNVQEVQKTARLKA